MAKAFREMGYKVAPQRPAELLVHDWYNGDFQRIFEFVRKQGNAFQDVPFCLPGMPQALDAEFPGSKFILTVRDSPEIWHRSLVRFHGKLFANMGVPTKADLMAAGYVRKGWMWEVNRMIFDTPENDLYEAEGCIRVYNQYNTSVLEHFKGTTNKLLVLNLTNPNALRQINGFLNAPKRLKYLSWENKT